MAENWICRYEIREDGVYLDGQKVGDLQATDLAERFDFEQQLFIGSRPRRRLFQGLRKLIDPYITQEQQAV